MKNHPYEYKIMVEYISPEEAGRYPHFTRIEDQEGLVRTLEDIVTHLPQAIPEGWDVVSHDVAISRNTLIITVLLRRPKKKFKYLFFGQRKIIYKKIKNYCKKLMPHRRITFNNVNPPMRRRFIFDN